MEKYYKRDEYLNFLISFKDKELIKVVSGIRRCGKSTLFRIYQDYLRSQGVDDDQIIDVNLEDIDNEELKDYQKLYKYIMEKVDQSKKNYVFIDEIQNCPSFEKVVDSLFIKEYIDVYITGSNAYFMSGELATLLSGRYVELKMLPLSFKEYVEAHKERAPLMDLYNKYLVNSSFPYALKLEDSSSNIKEYLNGLYSSILLRDVIDRYKISDVMMLESLIQFVFDNVGNRLSAYNIANVMKANGRQINEKTVEKYLKALCDSLLIYQVKRYSLKGKNILKTQNKYYVVDIGLRYLLLGTRNQDHGHILENIVYLELIRRGYKVYMSQSEVNEIDFVAMKYDETIYIQVALSVVNEDTLAREIKPLKELDNHHPKLILTLDNLIESNENGIKIMNALNWLME